MTFPATDRPRPFNSDRFAASFSPAKSLVAVCLVFVYLPLVGCDSKDPIVEYEVPTELPEQLQQEDERMLATMVPQGDQVWFFKVTGPESSIGAIEEDFRSFVESIEFSDGKPDLTELPAGWRLGREAPMRYATIDVDTPDRQLNISVSNLARQDDWDQQVVMNVNRWRGQLGLEPSDEKWAAGESLSVASADTESIWVDLTGKPDASSAMTPPFAGGGAMNRPPMAPAAAPAPTGTAPASATAATERPADSRLKYELPEGWRAGRMSSMRMAAFNAGPEDAAAELTVIPAGGDLRGNVARWLGQAWSEQVPEDVVDTALENAEQVEVDGRGGQRFWLTGKDDKSGTAIDATIIPLDDGISLFVKMTGPVDTVRQEREAIAAFLKSLELNL